LSSIPIRCKTYTIFAMLANHLTILANFSYLDNFRYNCKIIFLNVDITRNSQLHYFLILFCLCFLQKKYKSHDLQNLIFFPTQNQERKRDILNSKIFKNSISLTQKKCCLYNNRIDNPSAKKILDTSIPTFIN